MWGNATWLEKQRISPIITFYIHHFKWTSHRKLANILLVCCPLACLYARLSTYPVYSYDINLHASTSRQPPQVYFISNILIHILQGNAVINNATRIKLQVDQSIRFARDRPLFFIGKSSVFVFFPSAVEAEISEIKFCPSNQKSLFVDDIGQFQMLKLFTKKEKKLEQLWTPSTVALLLIVSFTTGLLVAITWAVPHWVEKGLLYFFLYRDDEVNSHLLKAYFLLKSGEQVFVAENWKFTLLLCFWPDVLFQQ